MLLHKRGDIVYLGTVLVASGKGLFVRGKDLIFDYRAVFLVLLLPPRSDDSYYVRLGSCLPKLNRIVVVAQVVIVVRSYFDELGVKAMLLSIRAHHLKCFVNSCLSYSGFRNYPRLVFGKDK